MRQYTELFLNRFNFLFFQCSHSHCLIDRSQVLHKVQTIETFIDKYKEIQKNHSYFSCFFNPHNNSNFALENVTQYKHFVIHGFLWPGLLLVILASCLVLVYCNREDDLGKSSWKKETFKMEDFLNQVATNNGTHHRRRHSFISS